jgi:hypothetical protein
LWREWEIDSDDCAAAGFGMYGATSSQVRHSFFDSQEAETFRLFDIETLSVISNGEREVVRFLQHLYSYRRRVRMPRTIVQRFLHDAIDAGLVLVRQIV